MMNNVVDISDWEAAAETEVRESPRAIAKARAVASDAVQRVPEVAHFRFVVVGDLELKEPEFLIDGLIETDTLGLLFGDPGCGKTFVAVDLAMCVATGEDFHGHKTKRGPVFYIAGEGHSGLARRFAAWAEHHGRGLAGVPVFKSAGAAQFLDAASAESVAIAVDGLASEYGHPAIIVVDTLARNFGGGDENSTKEMGAFITAMDELRSRWPGAVILIVHHSGHASKERARGSMALKGALDFEYRVAKDGNRIHLSNTKMKDAEPPANMHFTLDTVELSEGGMSAVLIPAEGGNCDDDAPVKLSGNTKLARETYIVAAAAHGIFDPDEGLQGVQVAHWRAAFYAKHTSDNTGAKKKAFQNARKALVEKGLMTVVDDVYLTTESEVLIRIAIKSGERDKRDVPGQD